MHVHETALPHNIAVVVVSPAVAQLAARSQVAHASRMSRVSKSQDATLAVPRAALSDNEPSREPEHRTPRCGQPGVALRPASPGAEARRRQGESVFRRVWGKRTIGSALFQPARHLLSARGGWTRVAVVDEIIQVMYDQQSGLKPLAGAALCPLLTRN